MKAIMYNSPAKGVHLGKNHFLDQELYQDDDPIYFKSEAGYVLTRDQVRQYRCEIEPAKGFEYPKFRSRIELGTYLTDTLKLSNADSVYGQIYLKVGSSLPVEIPKAADHPGARDPLAHLKKKQEEVIPKTEANPYGLPLIERTFWDRDGSVKTELYRTPDNQTLLRSYEAGSYFLQK